MDEKVSARVIFLKTANSIWDTLKEMYSNEQKISRVADLYERLFALRQDGRPLTDYYFELKRILDGWISTSRKY